MYIYTCMIVGKYNICIHAHSDGLHIYVCIYIHYIIIYYAILHYTILYYTILHYTTYTILYKIQDYGLSIYVCTKLLKLKGWYYITLSRNHIIMSC